MKEQIAISQEECQLIDVIGGEAFGKLSVWEAACNKECPITHQLDMNRWMDFLISLYENQECTLSSADFAQWLREDFAEQNISEEELSKIEQSFDFGITLLRRQRIG